MRTALLMAVLLLSSCAREAWHAPMVVPTDSTAFLLPTAPAGKYKFKGPVNIVVQRGNNNVATPTATAKVKADAAATAPAAAASSTKPAGVPWWVFVLVAAAGAALLAWLQSKFSFLPFGRR